MHEVQQGYVQGSQTQDKMFRMQYVLHMRTHQRLGRQVFAKLGTDHPNVSMRSGDLQRSTLHQEQSQPG